MAAKKTLEELRASAAARAKRWREKNRWKHRERVKAVYGRSFAQKSSAEGVLPQEVERYAREVQESTYVPIEEVERSVEPINQAPRVTPRVMEPKPEVTPPVAITREERRIAQWLEAKKTRRPAAEEAPQLLEIQMP